MFLNILAHRLRVFFFFLFLSLSFDLDSRKHRRRSIPNVSESDGFTRNRRTKKQSVAVRAMDESRDNAWSGGHDRIRKKQITFTRRKYKSIGLVNIWLRWRDIYFCSPPVKIIRIYSLFSYFFFFFKFCFHTMQTICAFFTRRARMLNLLPLFPCWTRSALFARARSPSLPGRNKTRSGNLRSCETIVQHAREFSMGNLLQSKWHLS